MLVLTITSTKEIAAFGGNMRKYLAIIGIPTVLISLSIYIYYESSENGPDNLTVYTYSSFSSSWGPAHELRREFKKWSGFSVEFVDAGEAGVIMQRLSLEQDKPKADIVLGLDQFQINDPGVRSFFNPLPDYEFDKNPKISDDKIRDSHFIAYNWAPMAFVYRHAEIENPPRELDDFTKEERTRKIILLDPRTSSPGFIFFSWLLQERGEKGAKDFLSQIRRNVYTVAPSWSAGYGMFKKKQSSYIFSYVTSPIFHWVEEGDPDYRALKLKDPMPYHIEYVGVVASSGKKSQGQRFIEFLLTPPAQEIIMNKNYMLPVVSGVAENTPFENVDDIELIDLDTTIPVQSVLDVWKALTW